MTDYSKNVDYAAKDALATGDAAKKILGTEVGGEFDELVTAVASKYDSSDIASQAQAIAGVSNTTLITPLRLQQALNGGSGFVGDIAGLVDPNADEGLFWDDSAGSVALFTLGTGLAFSGTVLGLVLGSIDHNSLLNFVANKHIDHTTVSISGAGGITGGGTIAANRTLTLDVTSLTEDTSPALAADYILTYDASAVSNKKVLLSNLVGNALGDGTWYRATAQSIPAATETTVVFSAAEYDHLQRGTFSTSTGIYTAGASGARIEVCASLMATTLAAGNSLIISIYKDSTEKARQEIWNAADHTALPFGLTCFAVLELAAGSTMTVKCTASAAVSLTTGAAFNRVTITELA